MNQPEPKIQNDGTRGLLLQTARELFAQHGFRGTTIRAISARAGANLGAVTYHFGTKEALYHAVLDGATAPLRHRLSRPVSDQRSATDQIEDAVRGIFAFLRRNPDLPRLVMQVLVTDQPLPPPGRATITAVLQHFTRLIERGQRDGTIRSGPPALLALAFAGQPIFLALYRRALSEAVGLDQSDPETSRRIEETVVGFIRAGLAAEGAA